MGPVAIRPSANRTESAESFQPWFARPCPERSTYSNRPSPSASPKSAIQHSARSAAGSKDVDDRRIQPEPPGLGQQTDPERGGVHRAVVDGRKCGVVVVGPRSSCNIFPGSSPVTGSSAVPCRAASVSSVPAASSGPSGSSIRAAHKESRPNKVRYHGEPAARKVSSGARSEVIRSASRSATAVVTSGASRRSSASTTGATRPPDGRGGPTTAAGSALRTDHATVSCCPGGTRIGQQISTPASSSTSDTTGSPPTASRTERPGSRPGGTHSDGTPPVRPRNRHRDGRVRDLGTVVGQPPSGPGGTDRPALTAQIPARSVANRSRTASSIGSSRTLLTVMDSAHPNGTARRSPANPDRRVGYPMPRRPDHRDELHQVGAMRRHRHELRFLGQFRRDARARRP